MNVLVDNSIWSLSLRRREEDLFPSDHRLRQELADLIREQRVVIIGPIRQELPCGIADPNRYKRLRDALRAFDDESVLTVDYERAAELFNLCRAHGIQGSRVDLLICAVADRLTLPVFTTDRDFARYAEHISVALHDARSPLA